MSSSARLREIADEELDDIASRGLGGAPMLWERSRAEIVDDLVRWLDGEIADPGGVLRAGLRGRVRRALARALTRARTHATSRLTLTIDGQELRLRGRIDRLEWRPASRSASSTTSPASNRQKGVFDGGKALQLAIYLLAGADIVGIDVENGDGRLLLRHSPRWVHRARADRSGSDRRAGGVRRRAHPHRRGRQAAATSMRSLTSGTASGATSTPSATSAGTAQARAEEATTSGSGHVRRRCGRSSDASSPSTRPSASGSATRSTRASASRPAPAPARRPCSSSRVVERAADRAARRSTRSP